MEKFVLCGGNRRHASYWGDELLMMKMICCTGLSARHQVGYDCRCESS